MPDASADRPTATSKKSAATPKPTASAKSKGKPWTFPKNTLEEAISVAKAIEEKNAGNPMRAPELAKAVGYRQPSDWRFLDLLRSANQYGLVSGSGANATISMTKLGQDVVAPSSPTQRSEALLQAFRSVKDFEEVEKFYKGKRIPEDEFFLNTLTRDFRIPRDRVEQFAAAFTKNLEFLKAFSAGAGKSDQVPESEPPRPSATPAARVPSPEMPKEPRTREFLDTCFVMMPFGQWFDRYYQEILTIANGKPIGFGEVGTPPPPEVLMAQPKWTFYMTWAGMSGATAPAGRGGRGAVAYPIPEGASVDMLRRIAERLEPGAGNVVKAIYDDPYYLKRGDPIPAGR